MNPCFAIIDPNTLECLALRSILWEIFNDVETHIYGDLDTFIKDSNRHFVHFFVSRNILFSNVDEFELLKDKTTVISVGNDNNIAASGFNQLDISLSEQDMISSLLHINDIGNRICEKNSGNIQRPKNRLSNREKEVLGLMAKGLINKEIGKQLNISTTTVIFHRNNICEKLQTRSLGKLTVYAVLTGIIALNEI